MTESEKYDLRWNIWTLLDTYRDETACRTYNGWVKYRDPEEIREDIDKHINNLLGLEE